MSRVIDQCDAGGELLEACESELALERTRASALEEELAAARIEISELERELKGERRHNQRLRWLLRLLREHRFF